ncbi:DUF3649 domain-containing protein [Paraburkholderia sacchari]
MAARSVRRAWADMFVPHGAAHSRQRRNHGKDPKSHGLIHRRLWPDCG